VIEDDVFSDLRVCNENGKLFRVVEMLGSQFLCTTDIWFERVWTPKDLFWTEKKRLRHLNEMETLGAAAV